MIIGGGDPPPGPPPSNKIEGTVYSTSGGPVTNMIVNLCDSFFDYGSNYTDSSGHFQFTGGCVKPEHAYYISVNGLYRQPPYVGIATWDFHWGQWLEMDWTDENAYYGHSIYLAPAAHVSLTMAALFSNTKYATENYEVNNEISFSHSITFSVENSGSGVQTGFSTSETLAYCQGFGADPNICFSIQKPAFASTFFNALPNGVSITGVSGSESGDDWGTEPATEYLNPNSAQVIQNCKNFTCARGTYVEKDYTETGSYTWTSSTPFGMQYSAFGMNLSLDSTVTTTASSKVHYIVDRRGDTDPTQVLNFRAYTLGTLLNPDGHVGGFELHIWDVSGAG